MPWGLSTLLFHWWNEVPSKGGGPTLQRRHLSVLQPYPQGLSSYWSCSAPSSVLNASFWVFFLGLKLRSSSAWLCYFLTLHKAPFPFGCFLLGLFVLHSSMVGHPMLQLPKEQRYPLLPVYAVLSWVQIMQVFRIFKTRKDIDDYDCTRGLYEHRKRVCTESWPTVGENSHATRQ